MHTPFVGVLATSLVPEQTLKKVLSEGWVGVQKDRPCGEDNIHGVHVLKSCSSATVQTGHMRTYTIAGNFCGGPCQVPISRFELSDTNLPFIKTITSLVL